MNPIPERTPIAYVRFPKNVLAAAGLKPVGDVRETTDETLLSLQDLGSISVKRLRETLGLPSRDGSGRVSIT